MSDSQTTTSDTPTLKQIVEAREHHKAKLAALTKAYEAEKKVLDEIIDGCDELILDMFVDGETSRSVQLDDGTKISISRGVNSQFRLLEGKSDEFYTWARENGRTDLLQRRISQDAMTAEVQASNGALPPGVFVHTEPKLNFAKKRAAPDVT